MAVTVISNLNCFSDYTLTDVFICWGSSNTCGNDCLQTTSHRRPGYEYPVPLTHRLSYLWQGLTGKASGSTLSACQVAVLCQPVKWRYFVSLSTCCSTAFSSVYRLLSLKPLVVKKRLLWVIFKQLIIVPRCLSSSFSLTILSWTVLYLVIYLSNAVAFPCWVLFSAHCCAICLSRLWHSCFKRSWCFFNYTQVKVKIWGCNLSQLDIPDWIEYHIVEWFSLFFLVSCQEIFFCDPSWRFPQFVLKRLLLESVAFFGFDVWKPCTKDRDGSFVRQKCHTSLVKNHSLQTWIP